MECGACAVFMAWGEPYKAEKKMHRYFVERLAPLIDPDIPPVVQWIWEYERSGGRHDTDLVLAASERVIGVFSDLAKNDPPAAWQPQPIPRPVGWDGLSGDEQSFLRAALATALQQCPGVRIMLFGSRAAGKPAPDSDYDLIFIFPDSFPEGHRRETTAEVGSLATHNGIEIDPQSINHSGWLSPSEDRQLFIKRIKACHIEIPDQ
jgi:predicted nucleotidyltransferase